MGTQLPAGWYVDPSDGSRYRYWSGDQWSTHTRNKAEVDIDAAEAELRPLPDFDALDDDGKPITAASKRRRLPAVLALVAIAAVAATAGVVTFGPHSSGHRLTGEIRVPVAAAGGAPHQAAGFVGDGAPCGAEGSRGVRSGTTVTVTSAHGDELGSSELGEGRVDQNLTSTACVFEYVVDGVDDAGMYVVRVGNRRAARASRDSVEAADWHLDGRLG